MFRFEHPEHLYALAVLPGFVLLYLLWWRWRRRMWVRMGDPPLLSSLMPEAGKFRHMVKFLLFLSAVASLVVAWANPQWGTRLENVERKGVDVFIALDISTSMYATDLAPNRLERAKVFAARLVDALRGERIGLIFFAGNAYLQSPLTDDYAVIQLFLQNASPELAGTQGTSIARAIDAARLYFPDDDASHKALVLISDSEDHDGEVLQDARRQAVERGTFLFTVGVGTPEGSLIPVVERGRKDYKRDEHGELVRSRLDESVLRELARAGGGAYFSANDVQPVVDALRERIDRLDKNTYETRAFTDYESYFHYFIAVALLLTAADFLLSYRKGPWLRNSRLFGG
ncbi:MAG: hypothetical protein RLY31_2221 [Bacteroidota bacterium]|jgi:Ca-activated chloride channel family protein